MSVHVGGMTERVWRMIVKHGQIPTREIKEALGITAAQLKQALVWCRKTRLKNGEHLEYYAGVLTYTRHERHTPCDVKEWT